MRELILGGEDPLGEAFCQIRSAEVRRESGATYTPPLIVKFMLDLAAGMNPEPQRVTTLEDMGGQNAGKPIGRDRLRSESKWTLLTRTTPKTPQGFVELGELFRVHRGQVTGANHLWIAGPHSVGLPESVLFKSITRAREILNAGGILRDASLLRSVIDIPADLDVLAAEEKRPVLDFIKRVRALGGDRGYVVQNRKAWWSVGLRTHAPIVATYMARRPPAFALNEIRARHINIAHGLEELTDWISSTRPH